jgi:hypothetical protein
MSAELPQLERLIADAAERHYAGRRWLHVPVPRLSLVAGLVVATAAVVLAIALLPLRSDEQSANPPADPTGALAEHYGIFANGQDVGPREYALAADQLRALDSSKPVAIRVLRSLPGGGIVAIAGTGPKGQPAVCLSEQHKHVGGGGCKDVSDLVREQRPWFTFGVPGQIDTAVTALVPDEITSVRMELESGATRTVPIKNNLAYASAGETVCAVSWTKTDGSTGRERSLFDSETPNRC